MQNETKRNENEPTGMEDKDALTSWLVYSDNNNNHHKYPTVALPASWRPHSTGMTTIPMPILSKEMHDDTENITTVVLYILNTVRTVRTNYMYYNYHIQHHHDRMNPTATNKEHRYR